MPALITTDVPLAAAALRDGQLVAFATETVYGLGGNALDERAVARIFEAKNRPSFDPLIVHLSTVEQLSLVVREVPELAWRLIREFWPGPLTLVLLKQEIVPDLVTSGLEHVAVRIPDHPQALELLKLAGVPVAAPSANPFGRISPTTAQHVQQHLGDKIDYVLDGGPCRVGVESTVVAVNNDTVTLLRPGGITREELEQVVGPIQTGVAPTSQSASSSPGMLSQHYAPRTPLKLVDQLDSLDDYSCKGLLAWQSVPELNRFAAVRILSEQGSLTEATANFFALLRELDEEDIEEIIALRLPDRGLGVALNDRLIRASRR